VLANISPSVHDAAAWAASGITAEFDVAAGRMSGFAGCNDYTAKLTITSELFQVAQPAATRKMCPSETTTALEQEYLGRIAQTNAFAAMGDQLDLSLSDGSGLQFRAAPK
jgi:heat shock protein HslJ